jgi:RNA polymerase sigma-70 factor
MLVPDPVVQAFEEGCSGRPSTLSSIPGDLADRVARAAEAVRRAFPDLEVDPVALARHLGRHVHDEPAWERLRPSELALCLACGSGSSAAVARFEALFEPTLRAVLRRFSTANVPADELAQLLRERLFVGNGSPKILEYSGQGFLENWLRVTAVRTFTDAVRSGPKREVPLPEGLLEAESGDDVELTYLKTHYRAALKRAFEHAVSSLDGGSRNLLRQSVVQRLTIDQIGAL